MNFLRSQERLGNNLKYRVSILLTSSILVLIYVAISFDFSLRALTKEMISSIISLVVDCTLP